MMKVLTVALAAILLSSCVGMPDRDRNTLAGIGAGAGVGALIGTAGGPAGTWIGAASGAAAGGVIASLIRPDACYFRNRRGELWQVPCDGPVVGAEACYVGNRDSRLQPVPCRRRYRS